MCSKVHPLVVVLCISLMLAFIGYMYHLEGLRAPAGRGVTASLTPEMGAKMVSAAPQPESVPDGEVR